LWVWAFCNLPSKSDYFLREIDPTALEEGMKAKSYSLETLAPRKPLSAS